MDFPPYYLLAQGKPRGPLVTYIGEATLMISTAETVRQESSHCHQTKQHTFKLGLWKFRVGAY